MMRRTTRTRRLSIAALASSLAFVAVAGAAVRSFWIPTVKVFGDWNRITLEHGSVTYLRLSKIGSVDPSAAYLELPADSKWNLLGFGMMKRVYEAANYSLLSLHWFIIPLWFPLLFLLI